MGVTSMGAGGSIRSYLIGSTLGVGTFGKVKIGTHKKTGEKVAIKIVNKRKMLGVDAVERLSREISAMSELDHPCIIKLIELIDTPNNVFIIMEYVKGGELFDYISQNSRLSEAVSVRILKQVISGLVYCHNKMLCHRDLKPENILFDEHFNIKICDFGLSNYMRLGECLYTPCGSPNYASPEVITGVAYAGPEVDIWSCGIIFYVLLCGYLPFDDDEMPILFRNIKLGKFHIPGHVSNESRRLLNRMLNVNPQARMTIQELLSHPWFRGSFQIYRMGSKEVMAFPEDVVEEVTYEYTADAYDPHNVAAVEEYRRTHSLNRGQTRWMLGFQCCGTEITVTERICNALTRQGYQWKFLPNYKILCKKGANNQHKFIIQLYKIEHRLFSVDIQILESNLLEHQHEAIRIARELKR